MGHPLLSFDLFNNFLETNTMTTTPFKPGVASGDALQALFQLAKARQFAIPAVNVINTSTVNAVIETAQELNRRPSFSSPMGAHSSTLAKA